MYESDKKLVQFILYRKTLHQMRWFHKKIRLNIFENYITKKNKPIALKLSLV